MIKFEIKNTFNKARAGVLHTKHGIIETPVFMPVGTLGSVKGITKDFLREYNFNILLANTVDWAGVVNVVVPTQIWPVLKLSPFLQAAGIIFLDRCKILDFFFYVYS